MPAARRSLSAHTRTLSDVCMGRTPADLLITGGRLVNVHTREVHEGVDVAVKDGRVAMFGDAAHTRGPETEVLDAGGAYLVPGLIDTHLHVESAMVTVARFAEAVLPHGTTTVLIDNHEIANVLGLDGIRWMLEEGRDLPLKVLLAVPSCVPALPGFEDAGAVLGPDDIRTALQWDGVAALGEMMNMPGVYGSDAGTHEMIGAVLDAGLPVTGHWSLHGWTDHRLHAYVAAGVDSDHECVFKDDALAKLRAGMWVQFREGSAWHDVAECVRVLTEDGVDSRHALLVTDDMHPGTLAGTGHLNHAVRTAIEAGLDPLLAIQLATLNAAEYIGRRHDLGSIAPGRCADILFVEDVATLRPHLVLADGRRIPEGELPALAPPPEFRETVRLQRALDTADLRIAADGPTARVRAIGMVPGELATESRVVTAPVVDGAVPAAPDLDLAKAASIERHGGSGSIGLGFVQGLGLQRGAVATTVAHDNHNLFVVGTNDADMRVAVERLAAAGGGMVAVEDGKVRALVELPIAGLISDRPVAEVAAQVRALDRAYADLGTTIEFPFMMVSFLSLAVIPALRLTNRGLVDGREFCFVDPVVT
ncbi:MAG: adenine deaminase [Solirubrobacteraceae bacterium]|jgi:adenine deaminase|nr:adenine deaminase [Solirubrobacteraceae bacterium]